MSLKWDMGFPELLTEVQIERMERIGRNRAPAEACGILLPESWHGQDVIELPNRSLDATHKFVMNQADVLYELHDWLRTTEPSQRLRMTVWHTHPSGGVGPSRTDMQNRVPQAFHLVVTLTDKGPIPTWY